MMDTYDQTLEQMVTEARSYAAYGQVADYIPALRHARASDVSIAIMTDRHCYKAGDVSAHFTLQSISKIIALALALIDHPESDVFDKVGMEPTGDPFNSISRLEKEQPSRPLNPMINAGALTVTDMIKGASPEEKIERLLSLIRTLTQNPSLHYNETVAVSEYNTAYLNRSLCYFLKEHNVITDNIESLMETYTKQCAIELNGRDLARIGWILANEGRDMTTDEQILSPYIARLLKTFMVTCGMYNASGEFAIKVGIPAKSGVSGGILATVPGTAGIGVYAPALDHKGNSRAGIKLLQALSQHFRLSIF